MATPLPEVRCALCQNIIPGPRQLFRASGSFLPPGDPLTPYCDAPLHWECYWQWPERARFARHYVEGWVEANRRNPFWWGVFRDERVYLSANPSRGIEQASLRLYEVGTDIRVPLPRWREWLEQPERITPNLHAYERQALAEILPALRARFPDDHAIVDAIDPAEKN